MQGKRGGRCPHNLALTKTVGLLQIGLVFNRHSDHCVAAQANANLHAVGGAGRQVGHRPNKRVAIDLRTGCLNQFHIAREYVDQ